MKPKRVAEKRQALVLDEAWGRVTCLIDEAFAGYERGLVTLRKKVVEDMKRAVRGRKLRRRRGQESRPKTSGNTAICPESRRKERS